MPPKVTRTPPPPKPAVNCNSCQNDDENMVECVKCKDWFHFTCVGVDSTIKDIQWSCENCKKSDTTNPVPAPHRNSKQTKHLSVRSQNLEQGCTHKPTKSLPALSDDLGAAGSSQKSKRMPALFQNHQGNALKLPAEDCQDIHANDKTVPASYKSVSKASSSRSSKGLTLQLKRLEEEKLLSEKRDREYLKQKYLLLEQQAFSDEDGSLNSQSITSRRVASWVNEQNQKPSILKTTLTEKEARFSAGKGLEASHLAARQVIARDQIIFNGRPEEWPLFISWFENSTKTCGFSNQENLSRLQRCLKGTALEAVRCRLVHPEQVPGIISQLKMLFGRPETIIYSLMEKIRSEPAPKAEKLESIIKFSISVQNLCATMESTGMTNHMLNPCLIHELSEKLPPAFRLQWGMIKQQGVNTADLPTFSRWLSQIAEAASAVTLIPIAGPSELRRNRQEKFVNLHSNTGSQSFNKNNMCVICKSNCSSLDKCTKFNSMQLNAKWSAIKENNLCRTCLRKHSSSNCPSFKECGIDGCTYKHHPLLHKTKKVQSSTFKEQVEPVQSCNVHQAKTSAMLFKIVPVTLYNDNAKIDTYAFFDDGSSVSLMDNDLATKLGIDGEKQPLCLKWTSNTHRTESDSKIINVQISAKGSQKKHNMFNVRTIESLNLFKQSMDADQLQQKFDYLKSISLKSYSDVQPKILIGLDNYNLGLPSRIREGGINQPVAAKTPLGWSVFGPCQDSMKRNDKHNYTCNICKCQSADDEIMSNIYKKYIALESFGTKACKQLLSVDDEKALSILQKETFKEEERFVVPLLWRYDNFNLPNSRPMAEQRLKCLTNKLSKNTLLADNLYSQLESYVKAGYVRKLNQDEIQSETECKKNRIWYLPIFAVTNPNKPGKVRMVWDAAAKVNGISLNSMLLPGPDTLPLLPSILFQFRERKIAISGDIKEMFHQVRVNRKDQNSQRFLWKTKEGIIEEYAMQVMTFGSTCSPSCAQYVKNKNAEEFKNEFPSAAKVIIENHYVDDFLGSVDTEEEAMTLARDVIYVHSKAGFEIRNFISNSNKVVEFLQDKAAHFDKKITSWNLFSNSERVLGLWWSPSKDSFTFSFRSPKLPEDILTGVTWPSKRQILKTLMSIFDPLGLISNYLIFLKILLQEIWCSGIDWDEKIHQEHVDKWCLWIKSIPRMQSTTIPRPYASEIRICDSTNVQLHVFVDASEAAYAAVAYFRISSENTIECSLVSAKTKVAPIKAISIPRMELEAAVLGLRLSKVIIAGHSIKVSEVFYWSDSKTIISWINSDSRRYKHFVAFRVGEILENSNAKSWRFIPSKDNVADLATKWKNIDKIDTNSSWLTGPEFLYKHKSDWPPQHEYEHTSLEEVIPLLATENKIVTPLIDVHRFSSWNRLLRAMSNVYRFVRITTKGLKQNLISSDFQKAENYLIRISQFESFPTEIAMLIQSNGKIGTLEKSSPLYKYSPYLDEEQIIRVRGRIDAAECVSSSTKRPILLPKGNHTTKLIIQHFHQKYHHQYNETVLNEIRQVYCIPALRSLLKKVKLSCQTCKNMRATPNPPLMGDLPPARLKAFTRPFSFIGIDYFGPMVVVIGRRTEKRWGVLITCLTIRAIHIEIATSLSSDSCILALKRFMARRGEPMEVFSDNGTNFRGASAELKEAAANINSQKIASEFVSAKIKWNFIPPAAPHMGGSWERLVRSVKNTLASIIITRNPTDELLLTMMAEVECVINSRPLTYVPIESESDEALTPNHFLMGSSNGTKSFGKFCDEGSLLKKNWRTSEQYAHHFWKRWVQEYLPTLTRRTKWFQHTEPVREGDIVIIVDPANQKGTWPKGKVLKVIPGKDNQVRSAVIQTATGVYTRPSSKLAVLDVAKFDECGKSCEGDLPGGSVVKHGCTAAAPHYMTV